MKTRQYQSPSSSRQRNMPPSPVLPDDLIVEILSWLPVKSLGQFRCVCKWLKSLISNPNFVKLHLHRSSRKANLLLLWEKVSDDFEELNVSIVPCSVRSLLGMGNPLSNIDEGDCYSLTDESGYDVVGSCNGLVCLRGDNNGAICFYLWNPATKLASKDLAYLRVSDDYFFKFRYAFGYDNLTDTYKLVAFTTFDGEAKEESRKVQVKICSLSDNCWRNIHSFPVIPFDSPSHVPRRNNAVYFNGTVNWLALCNINSDDYNWNDTVTIAQLVIISLDLGMETYTQLLLPRLDEAPQSEPTIGVLMDCMCFSYDCKGTHFVIWQMKEFGVEKSWTQFLKVSYKHLQIDWLDDPFPLIPLCASENGDVLIMASNEYQAILYHRRDNRVERTELPDDISWNDDTMDYVESLVSPYCN